MTHYPPPPKRNKLLVLVIAIGLGVILIVSGVAIRAGQAERSTQYLQATQWFATHNAPTATQFTPIPLESLVPATDTLAPTGVSLPATTTVPPTATNIPPSPTLTPSLTPPPPATARPTAEPTVEVATVLTPPPAEIPPPVDPIPVPDGVTNILLLGMDFRPGGFGGTELTDTIMVVSVNMREGTVNILSFPRDMLVVVPGWAMTRINTVYVHGLNTQDDDPRTSLELMQEMMLYNFGIQIDDFALVNLTGFKNIVDVLGGIEVPVDCTLQGWVLKEPRKGPQDFNTYQEWEDYTAEDSGNWEWYTMYPGVQQMDGYLAEWYARNRSGSTDYERAFRQQQVLRAIVNKARANGFFNITRIPELWAQYNNLVVTSLNVTDLLRFAPIAADMNNISVRSFVIDQHYLIAYDDPNTAGPDYYTLPNPDRLPGLIAEAMQPPAQNYVVNNTASVEVRNGTPFRRYDEVAADRLVMQGLDAHATGNADNTGYQQTMIYDYTGGRSNATQLAILQDTLGVSDANVISQPDPNRLFDFVVILGRDYETCNRAHQVISPPTPTPEPGQETPTAEPTAGG